MTGRAFRGPLVAAVLAVCAFGALAADVQRCLRPGTQQDLPQTLGLDLMRASTRDYEAEAPGFGCSAGYRGPGGVVATLYVYQAQLGHIEDRPRDERLLERFKSAVASIAPAWKRDRDATVTDVEARYETRGKADVEVMVARAVIDVPKDGLHRTYFQVWSGNGSIWKLRLTYPASETAMSDAAIVALTGALVDLSREAP